MEKIADHQYDYPVVKEVRRHGFNALPVPLPDNVVKLELRPPVAEVPLPKVA